MNSLFRNYLFGIIITSFYGCDVERECFICPTPIVINECNKVDNSDEILQITSFESGDDTIDFEGLLTTWDDEFSSIDIDAFYDTIGGGAMESQSYTRLKIVGNDGNSAIGWSGGGLSLQLTDCNEGVDMSDYDSLLFEIKTFPNSNLDETRIKLESVGNNNTPERLILKYGNFPSTNWSTIRIPLDEFNINTYSDTAVHNWVALDKTKVLKMVTVIINNQPSLPAMDGELGIDFVRFLKRN